VQEEQQDSHRRGGASVLERREVAMCRYRQAAASFAEGRSAAPQSAQPSTSSPGGAEVPVCSSQLKRGFRRWRQMAKVYRLPRYQNTQLPRRGRGR